LREVIRHPVTPSPCHPYASLAQWIEQRTSNPQVVGSNPTGGAIQCEAGFPVRRGPGFSILDKRITLTDAVDLFLLDAVSQGLTANTLRFYRGRHRIFLRHCQANGITFLDELSARAIRAFLAGLQERDLSSAYVHSHARNLRVFCNFCVRDGLFESSPFDAVKMPKLRFEVRDLVTAADLRAVLTVCDRERDRALLLLMLDTGVRASELTALSVGDVEGVTVVVRSGKGGKGRFVYIGAATRKQLRRYLILERSDPQPEEPLFSSVRGNTRLTYHGLASIFRRLRINANLEKLSPHMVRRSFAVASLNNGMNIYILARLMGHEDIQTLRHYLKYVQADIKKAAGDFGVVDSLYET
jgi:site-specific recombinase XerD